MKLLIVLITYNRLEYSKRTLKSLKETLTLPHKIIIADNASTDGTAHWAMGADVDYVVLNKENLYPAKACNEAWEIGLELYPETTHLMRCDNDMQFEKGWDTYAKEYFDKIEHLGQLGLDYDGGEGKSGRHYNGMELVEFPGCVGGPNIMPKHLFERGLKYDEVRWNDERNSKVQEDSMLSKRVKDKGYLVGHMNKRLSYTFADETNWKDYPEYYEKTMTDRGYDDKADFVRGIKND